ncbi:MAG: hypothetical protein JXJ22_05475 [Bacteroidales bacterium]|nr:hypothetical protein [Bacteroidales bacterium]
METNQIIETIGSVTKKEHLHSISYNVLPDTMVLENTNPFPGYGYQVENIPSDLKPRSIFLILRYRYAPEKIARITQSLINQNQLKCYAAYGEIQIRGAIYPCIRVKKLDCFEMIPKVQQYYKQNEIKLMGFKFIDDEGQITIHKVLKIIEISDGIYRDLFDKEKFYIKIDKQLNWKSFDSIGKMVKNNLANNNFDAALGLIYRFNGPEDVVRIYDKNTTLKRALELKKEFFKAVKKEFIMV